MVTERAMTRHAVYIPWRTFQTTLEILEPGVPPKVDRSVFKPFASGVRGQVLSALRFLALVDEEGAPQPLLQRLIDAQGDERRAVMTEILVNQYAAVASLGSSNSSLQVLYDQMRGYGVQGGTLERAVRFFLDAAEFAGLPLSVHWQHGRRSSASVPRQRHRQANVRKNKTVERVESSSSPMYHEAVPSEKSRNYRQFKLASGGTVIIDIDVDLFDLSEADRNFVSKLVDDVRNYTSSPNREGE